MNDKELVSMTGRLLKSSAGYFRQGAYKVFYAQTSSVAALTLFPSRKLLKISRTSSRSQALTI